MKKIFLAAVTALALCSYSYAQDDEDEYEEEEAPARVVKEAPAPAPSNWDEDEDEAPVAKKADKKKAAKKSASESGNGFFGIGLDLTGMLARSNAINLTFRLNDAMMLSAISVSSTTVKPLFLPVVRIRTSVTTPLFFLSVPLLTTSLSRSSFRSLSAANSFTPACPMVQVRTPSPTWLPPKATPRLTSA